MTSPAELGLGCRGFSAFTTDSRLIARGAHDNCLASSDRSDDVSLVDVKRRGRVSLLMPRLEIMLSARQMGGSRRSDVRS